MSNLVKVRMKMAKKFASLMYKALPWGVMLSSYFYFADIARKTWVKAYIGVGMTFFVGGEPSQGVSVRYEPCQHPENA